MTTANGSSRRYAKLLVVDRDGRIRHLPRAALACLFSPGDLIIANDVATLPASLRGIHDPSGGSIEVRLAAWESVHDPTQFTAIAFGAGDYRTPTEDRISPPPLSPGDRISLGPQAAGSFGRFLEAIGEARKRSKDYALEEIKYSLGLKRKRERPIRE
jgi:S-adenosylmethionine:tRNA ribosyltransferase-isomerase